MGVQVSVPFALSPDGSISKRTDPDMQAFDRLQSLLNTEPGERVMLPDYGISATSLIFDPDVDYVRNELNNQIQYQSTIWEPDIEIRTVIVPDDVAEQGTAAIQVEFQVRTNVAQGNQYAVIGPSGVLLQKTLRV